LAKAANGLVDKEIAKFIDVQPATIRTYWDRLRMKLQAKNRTHAVSLAVALGWVTVDLSELAGIRLRPATKQGTPLA
jgi:DNA-binding NarL/FixJ family response regulator